MPDSGRVTQADAASEAKAIAKVVEALGDLDRDAVGRVLDWASKRYGVRLPPPAKKLGPPGGDEGREEGLGEFPDLASLYAAVAPKSEADKVLVAAYWQQKCEEKELLDSMSMNEALKDLGHGVSTITRECGKLVSGKPTLLHQVKKKGKTKQARKQYKLTGEGEKRIQQLIAANRGGGQGEE